MFSEQGSSAVWLRWTSKPLRPNSPVGLVPSGFSLREVSFFAFNSRPFCHLDSQFERRFSASEIGCFPVSKGKDDLSPLKTAIPESISGKAGDAKISQNPYWTGAGDVVDYSAEGGFQFSVKQRLRCGWGGRLLKLPENWKPMKRPISSCIHVAWSAGKAASDAWIMRWRRVFERSVPHDM
jgi:hypothetical protein